MEVERPQRQGPPLAEALGSQEGLEQEGLEEAGAGEEQALRPVSGVQSGPCGTGRACSSRGRCVRRSSGVEECSCEAGWSGDFCQSPCPGLTSDGVYCSGAGLSCPLLAACRRASPKALAGMTPAAALMLHARLPGACARACVAGCVMLTVCWATWQEAARARACAVATPGGGAPLAKTSAREVR